MYIDGHHNHQSPAVAHDGFNPELFEATGEVVHLSINHGCEGHSVIAQSVIFPTLNLILKGMDDNGNEVPAPADLAEIIENQSLEGAYFAHPRAQHFPGAKQQNQRTEQ